MREGSHRANVTYAAVGVRDANVVTCPVLFDFREKAAAGRGTSVMMPPKFLKARVVICVGVVEKMGESHVDVVGGDQLVLVALQVETELWPSTEQPIRQCEG